MGCQSSSTTAMGPPNGPARKVDQRLPFDSYRQLFSIKNWWKQVTRTLEDTAKDNLIRLFREHPEYKDLYPTLKALRTETQIFNSLAFENASSDMFNNLDEVMDQLDAVGNAITLLRQIGQMHKESNFPLEFFKHMEVAYLGAVKKTLDDRYTDRCDECFTQLYGFFYKHIEEGYGSE